MCQKRLIYQVQVGILKYTLYLCISSLHMEIVWDFQLIQFENLLVLLVYIILSLQYRENYHPTGQHTCLILNIMRGEIKLAYSFGTN